MMQNQTLNIEASHDLPAGVFDPADKTFKKIEKAMRETNGDLSESDIWEMLAEAKSPDWGRARETLRACEDDLEDRLSPDNVPLGLIGAALDAGALDHARMLHTEALANFTIVNETLRQQPGMQAALRTLLRLRNGAQASQQLTRQALRLTSQFMAVNGFAAQQPKMQIERKSHNLLSMIFNHASAHDAPEPMQMEPTPAPTAANPAVSFAAKAFSL